MTDPRIAIIYATVEGQTEKIARRIAARLESDGARAEVFESAEAPPAVAKFNGVILGSSVHTGHHGKKLVAFVKEHLAELDAMPSAFFSVSLSAVKHDEKHVADAMRMVDAFKAETGFTPCQVATVAGALQYSRYNIFIRWIMKRIARSEGGDTDTSRDYEYTDWEAVDAFADGFLESVRSTDHTD